MNLYDLVIKQYNQILDHYDLDEDIREYITCPKNEIMVNYPIRLDNGKVMVKGAGTFDAWHFCYGHRGSTALGSNDTNEHPPYEVWVSADDEFILLKAQVTGYMMTQYELVSLDVHAGGD